jgi:hypothetical protein
MVEPTAVTSKLAASGTGLLRVASFPGIIGYDFARAVSHAVSEFARQQADRLIIDLRGNCGGGLGSLRLMSYLTPQRISVGYSLTRSARDTKKRPDELTTIGRIPGTKPALWGMALKFKFVNKDRSIKLVTEGLGHQRFHGRIAILIDEYTRSGAEMRSSLKIAEVSFVAGTRTSEPAHGTRQIEQAQRILADHRQRLMHAISRMDGATPLQEGLAQRRLFIHGLPAKSERNYRENECLALHAADLLPTEIPWRGTVRTPAFLFETREKLLLPYSPFDPSPENSNMLVIATSGAGKTFVVMQMLISLSRLGIQISIIERGDSYAPLVEIMGGMCLAVTLNPWDLPPGEGEPSKDKVKFLANLTRHMISESGRSDAAVLDAVLKNAIRRVYARKKFAFENSTPVFFDLVDELTNYRDDEGLDQAMAEARVAAFKLSQWVGEKGIYSNLMDRPTTPGLDADWMYFNIEKLASEISPVSINSIASTRLILLVSRRIKVERRSAKGPSA